MLWISWERIRCFLGEANYYLRFEWSIKRITLDTESWKDPFPFKNNFHLHFKFLGSFNTQNNVLEYLYLTFHITNPENCSCGDQPDEETVNLSSIVKQNYILLKHSSREGKRRYCQPVLLFRSLPSWVTWSQKIKW